MPFYNGLIAMWLLLYRQNMPVPVKNHSCFHPLLQYALLPDKHRFLQCPPGKSDSAVPPVLSFLCRSPYYCPSLSGHNNCSLSEFLQIHTQHRPFPCCFPVSVPAQCFSGMRWSDPELPDSLHPHIICIPPDCRPYPVPR